MLNRISKTVAYAILFAATAQQRNISYAEMRILSISTSELILRQSTRIDPDPVIWNEF